MTLVPCGFATGYGLHDVDEAAGESPAASRLRQLGLFLEQRGEVIAANRETADIGQRPHSSDAMCIGNEQRQLTEELPRPELSWNPPRPSTTTRPSSTMNMPEPGSSAIASTATAGHFDLR